MTDVSSINSGMRTPAQSKQNEDGQLYSGYLCREDVHCSLRRLKSSFKKKITARVEISKTFLEHMFKRWPKAVA